MTREEFWDIIKKSEKINDVEMINETNKRELEKLTPQELVSYATHFDVLVDEAYKWDLWGAAYLMGGGCGDDGFIDFRYTLVSKGRDVYSNALDNPDTLVELELNEEDEYHEELFNELFGYIAVEVYEEKTGDDIYDSLPDTSVEEAKDEELQNDWDFDDRDECLKRLPKITEKFWEE